MRLNCAAPISAPTMNYLRSNHPYFAGPAAVGILFLRLFLGIAMALHGQSKIFGNTASFGFSWMGPDAPVPGILQFLAAFSEVFGGLAIAFGLFTPLACFGVMCTMFVAIISTVSRATVQAPAYFIQPRGAEGSSYEVALMYFLFALTILMTGPGIVSLDAFLFGGRLKERFAKKPTQTTDKVAV